MKRISTEAYQALRDALAVVTWFKSEFEMMVSTSLRDHPELLAGLAFASDTKRKVADELIRRLVASEDRYQDVTLGLMVELASRTRFPDIERRPEPDRTQLLTEARDAVAALAGVTERFSSLRQDEEKLRADREIYRAKTQTLRKFSDDIDSLKARFIELQGASDPHQRGYHFETLLHNMFKLFDMEPRLGYRTDTEQIDGSLSFDTDDYILEAKWLAGPVDRGTLDIFAAKVRRRGKNALGLFVSVSGFTEPPSTPTKSGPRSSPWMVTTCTWFSTNGSGWTTSSKQNGAI